jgi:hypothetical protein
MAPRSSLAILAAIALSSCHDAPTAPAGADDLTRRVAEMEARAGRAEARLAAIEAKASNVAKPAPAAATAAAEPSESFELVGGGANLGNGRHLYRSATRCEAARKVLLEEAARRETEARSQGAIIVTRADYSCIPA